MRYGLACVGIAALLLAAPAAAADDCMQSTADEEIAEGRLDIGRFQDAAGRPESACSRRDATRMRVRPIHLGTAMLVSHSRARA